uniref:Uncharacterized protein n=1 Tax=Anguilla anguilla TaxID=7936 RepID=A0A0E9Q990_ANGAN
MSTRYFTFYDGTSFLTPGIVKYTIRPCNKTHLKGNIHFKDFCHGFIKC